jgi:ankyrin repeat protein
MGVDIIIGSLIIILSVLFAGCSFGGVVKNGSIDEISEAVRNGADVNGKNDNGETPLVCALKYNKRPYDAAILLINAGAGVNGSDKDEKSALHYAVRLKDNDEAYRLVSILLDRGADVDAHGIFNLATPLMLATERSDGIEIVKLLLKSGAAVRSSDGSRGSVLHHAVQVRENTEIIELLIKHGADVNAGTPSYTPLHQAAYLGSSENIRTLIRHKASINVRGNTSGDKTPLELAVDAKQFESAGILVENGADINTTSYYQYKPFKYRNIKQSSMDKLVHVDLDKIQFERMTPLHRAVTHNEISFVEYLLKKGAKTDIDAHFGGYPLDFALFLNYHDIAELLIRYKAPALFADSYLLDAIDSSDAKKTKLLLGIGASVSKKDYNDDTPLHRAAKIGDISIIKLLLEYGSDRSVKNRQGKRPVDCAAHDEAMKILQ